MFLIGFHCHTSQLWHTCGRKWEGAYSVVLRLEKESYVWEIKPVSIIIHLVGGGVRWQTAYLLSDGSYAAVVCLRVFACARSCACVWVEGGGEKEKEGASLANGSGRQVMHLCRQRRRRRCRVSRREREREGGKQSTSTATNPTPSSPLMPRSASSHRKGCCFFILVLKRGSKSYLFLADRILPSCPRKDFSSKVESMGSVQISKWDQFSPSAREVNQIWRLKPNHNRSRPSFGTSQISTVKGAWKRADSAFNVTQTAVSPIADVLEMRIQVAMETEVGWGLTNIWSVFQGEEMRKHHSSTDICCLDTSVDWSHCWSVCCV